MNVNLNLCLRNVESKSNDYFNLEQPNEEICCFFSFLNLVNTLNLLPNKCLKNNNFSK